MFFSCYCWVQEYRLDEMVIGVIVLLFTLLYNKLVSVMVNTAQIIIIYLQTWL